MIVVEVEGLAETQEYLSGVAKKVSSDGFWATELGKIIYEAQRYAASISPVVTGAYAGAHRVAVSGKVATLSVDPSIRYAAAVEERHQVYARTADYAGRLVTDADILGALL